MSLPRRACLGLSNFGFLCVFAVQTVWAGSDARARFEAAVRDKEAVLSTIQGRIRVENQSVRTRSVEVLEGRFWVRRPGKMAVVYEAPSAQTVVCDGKTTWFYQPEVNQVTVSRGGARPVFIDFQAGFKGLLARGDVRKVEEIEGGYSLTVKRDGETMLVRVNGQTLLPYEVESRVDEHRTKVRFSELVVNSDIPESRFVFTAPEGTEVVEMPEEAP